MNTRRGIVSGVNSDPQGRNSGFRCIILTLNARTLADCVNSEDLVRLICATRLGMDMRMKAAWPRLASYIGISIHRSLILDPPRNPWPIRLRIEYVSSLRRGYRETYGGVTAVGSRPRTPYISPFWTEGGGWLRMLYRILADNHSVYDPKGVVRTLSPPGPIATAVCNIISLDIT